MNYHHPPKTAEGILSAVADAKNWPTLVGDLGEAYNAYLQDHSGFAAALWYWHHVLRAAAGALRNTLFWRTHMIQNHLLVALRQFQKNKGMSVINLTGLSLGIAAVLCILFFLRFEQQFDGHHEKADRLFRIQKKWQEHHTEWSATMPPALSPALQDYFTEIEASSRLIAMSSAHVAANDKYFFESGFVFADANILDLFTVKFIYGSAKHSFGRPDQVILSRSMALKYFGDRDPTGEVITYKNKNQFIVSGVIEDVPVTASHQIHFLASMDWFIESTPWLRPDSWGAFMLRTFVLLKEGAEADAVTARLHPFLIEHIGEEKSAEVTLKLQPITAMHIQTQQNNILLFGGIALLVLLVAVLNYINLATARASTRFKEMGIRKMAGAKKQILIQQFLVESAVLAVIAFVLALILTGIMLPLINGLLGTALNLNQLQDGRLLLWSALLMLAVAILTGLFPAFVMSAIRPAVLFRPDQKQHSRALHRTVMVVIQFFVTVVLVAMTLVITRQMRFITHRDPGFRKENILLVDVRDSRLRSNKNAIGQQLLKNPAVESVSFAMTAAHTSDYSTMLSWPGKSPETEADVHINFVDAGFVPTFDLLLTKGRNFEPGAPQGDMGSFLVNETLVRTIGLKDPIGSEITYSNNTKGRIVGVVRDFHMRSMHEPIYPLIMDYKPEQASETLCISLSGSVTSDITAEVASVLKEFAPDYPIVMRPLVESMGRAYAAERRMQKLFNFFSVLAIAIAAMGLLGLTAFTVQRQMREIGIRKTLGAPVWQIVYLLSSRLGRSILLGSVLAWPAIWWVSAQWLQRFAFRIEVDWMIYMLATATAFAAGLLTVSTQSLKAARANPVESIRYE